jgi:hypothetical protein
MVAQVTRRICRMPPRLFGRRIPTWLLRLEPANARTPMDAPTKTCPDCAEEPTCRSISNMKFGTIAQAT